MTYDIGILGAGKTGRGFIGRLLKENKKEFVFFDKSKSLIEMFQAGKYEVAFFSGKRPPMIIDGFFAYHIKDAKCEKILSKLSTLFVSIGGTNIKDAAQWLASNMKKELIYRSYPLNIILCENARDPAEKFKKEFLAVLTSSEREQAEKMIGFSDAAVFCTTIQKNDGSININSENYPNLHFDATKINGLMPELTGFLPVTDFENLLMRKIYTYNSASAVIAYLGWGKNYTIYGDAANDTEILELLDKHYEQINRAVCAEYGYSTESQCAFAKMSRDKFCDRSIIDSIERNAREPRRKLSAGERIIGPAVLIEKHNGDTGVMALTAAAAMLYESNNETEWVNLIKEKSLGRAFLETTGLHKEDTFYNHVMEKIKALKICGRGKLK